VANASIGIDVNAEDMTQEQWDHVMDVNLKCVLSLLRRRNATSAPVAAWNSGFPAAGTA
jgi:NAD(P)-dependent dehydrogenase (short-subunit alcohol dehydrogenase family)